MKTKFSPFKTTAAAVAFFLTATISGPFALAQTDESPGAQTDSTQPVDALPPDIQGNPALAEVINLSQSVVSDEVVANYINNSQAKFNLTADDIIYLKDIGLPDATVSAMIQHDTQLGGTPPPESEETAPAPPPTTTDVSDDYFYDSLAPYGTWVVIQGYGRCWHPSAVVYDSSWQPYCDHGHWVYTDDGWFWISDYSWGWAPFHYGRWFHDARFGWCWYPDTVWGPSWVCWRYSDDYCGWAPLPPHCEYRQGVGLVYNGVTVGINFDFGINVNFFTFVPTRNFCDPHPRRFRVPPAQVTRFYSQTTIINNFGGNNTTIINHGIPPEHITAVTHTPIHPVTIREASTPVVRGEQIDRSGALVVNRPHFNNSLTVNRNSVPHTIPSPTTGKPMQIPPPDQNRNNNRNYTLPHQNPPSQQLPNENTPQRNPPNQVGNTSPQSFNAQRNSPPAANHPAPPAPNYNQSQSRYLPPRMQQQNQNSSFGNDIRREPTENNRSQPQGNPPSEHNYNQPPQPAPNEERSQPPAAQQHESQPQPSSPPPNQGHDKDRNGP